MQWPTQHVLDVLDVESGALSAVTLRGVTLALGACETVHEVLVQLVTVRIRLLVAGALVVEVLLELFVRQVETGPVRHVHLEAPRGKALRLLLLDSRDFLFRVAH